MFGDVDTTDPLAVQAAAQAAFAVMFPAADTAFIPRAFGWVTDAFAGRHPEYQAVDVAYHDLEHTMQGTLCLMRLLRGRHGAGVAPALTPEMVQLALLGMLLHDTGYLKRRDDRSGTGAKYTRVHVRRSADFAADLLAARGYAPAEVAAVRRMIACTGVDAPLAGIPFASETERVAGLALGTADLLGQMAAPDYIERLPALYRELAEAAQHAPDRPNPAVWFSSAEELLRQTPAFWASTRARLDRDFAGLHRFLNDPFPDGPNPYLERIEANMARARQLAPA